MFIWTENFKESFTKSPKSQKNFSYMDFTAILVERKMQARFLVNQTETTPQTAGHAYSEWRWKNTFAFNKIVKNHGFKRDAALHIVGFYSTFL